MAGGSHKTNSRLNRHMLKSTPTLGSEVLDCNLGFTSAMLAMQGTPRAVAPTPRAPVHPTLRMACGVFLLVCASVSQLLTAIEIELYILLLPNIFIIHLDRLAIPARQTLRSATHLLTS